MPRQRKGSRVYWRGKRAWGDFRDFSDVGGGREPLVPRGAKLATTDSDIADELAAARVRELEEDRRTKALLGIERTAALGEFAEHHLREKAKANNVTDDWLEQTERQLQAAVDFFGEDVNVATITVRHVREYVSHLRKRPNGRGDTISEGTVRHYLNSLSNLYARAQEDGVVPSGYNPVSSLMDKPTGRQREAEWLEVHDAALFLESARTYTPDTDRGGLPCIYPLVATFLLTGGRRSEVYGLDVEDVSFDRRTVTFRPNEHRRLKTRTSHRTVPLWPQLEEILREYVFGGSGPHSGPLFPSSQGGIVTDTRKALDAIAERAGWKEGEIRTKMFRHTYCAARLQTLDRGHPVSPWTVSREMGHGGRSLVDRVYGHLGDVRHRTEVVEYRVEHHREALGERLTALLAKGGSQTPG